MGVTLATFKKIDKRNAYVVIISTVCRFIVQLRTVCTGLDRQFALSAGD